MILNGKFVIAGLLLVTLTIIIVGVDSRATGKKKEGGSIETRKGSESRSKLGPSHKVFSKPKRQVRAAKDEPESEHGEAASKKKHNKAAKAKKLVDEVIDVDKTTTQKPTKAGKETKSTKKPHKPGKGSTKKPAKKDKEEKDEDSKSKKSDDDKSKDEKPKGEDESKDDGGKTKRRNAIMKTGKPPVASRNHKMKTEEKLKLANERWLQNQEVVAIEHMLAGVHDWMKVLKQTKGKTYNKKAAGELLDKVNNDLSGMLSEQNKPKKLISFYRQVKIK